MARDEITLTLANDEAIILFDLLGRINSNDRNKFLEHDAEQKVLWNIEAQLEKILVEPLKPDYAEVVKQARLRINESH